MAAMDKTTFDKLTKFAQDIVDSTPEDFRMEDEWFEYDTGDEIFDVNIWFEDGPIRATVSPTRTLPNGYRETVCDQTFCSLPIKENRYVA